MGKLPSLQDTARLLPSRRSVACKEGNIWVRSCVRAVRKCVLEPFSCVAARLTVNQVTARETCIRRGCKKIQIFLGLALFFRISFFLDFDCFQDFDFFSGFDLFSRISIFFGVKNAKTWNKKINLKKNVLLQNWFRQPNCSQSRRARIELRFYMPAAF